ncbi:hypothetical protein SAMN05216275_14176 [Streptosporangium canum]|uniref:Uncharacterized protein n=1 Tax=Streptosporangium canum TaxID=324952 RepID=A0A1I4DLB0_9ACTN|nr:hypothetical protein [Streptosporangium canum]SFK92816.1 hypothetical protein SAMN05216275_14176 [Streptosporangium canum]
MATPNYPKSNGDVQRELRQGIIEAQAAAQNRVEFVQASKGLILPNLAGHPAAPASGVILYALAGHLWCKEADGSPHQLTS